MRPSTITLILLLNCAGFIKRATADDFRVADVFAGYSLLHGDLQKKASGWELSAGGYLKQWLSLNLDLDAHHQSAAGSLRHTHNVLFGPQFSHRTNRFTLFAHTLGRHESCDRHRERHGICLRGRWWAGPGLFRLCDPLGPG